MFPGTKKCESSEHKIILCYFILEFIRNYEKYKFYLQNGSTANEEIDLSECRSKFEVHELTYRLFPENSTQVM